MTYNNKPERQTDLLAFAVSLIPSVKTKLSADNMPTRNCINEKSKQCGPATDDQ